MVEAMSCRKPVMVLSDAIIPNEVKSRCAVVENFTDALNNVAYLESLPKLVKCDDNYRFAKEHDWDKCVEAHIKLYQEISG